MTAEMITKVKMPGVFVMRDNGSDKVVLIPPEDEQDRERDAGIRHPDQSISKPSFFKVCNNIRTPKIRV